MKRAGKPRKAISTRQGLAGRSDQAVSRVQSEHDFPIVGLGASAGGLNALTRLFDAMPEQPGIAFIIIQHLDPTKASLTAELLSKHTTMKVAQVEDAPRAAPNCVYVIPPNKYLSIVAGRLHLSEPERRRSARAAIDFFFRSLAEDARQRAVAVILSGTGADGTLGLKAIKAEGGLVIAQKPNDADHPGMPESAIGTGLVDYILPVERIPDALVRYMRHALLPQADDEVSERIQQAGSELDQILALLRSRRKQDFRSYKEGTLLRRTRRRMSLHMMDQLSDYLGYLREDPGEADALARDLLISVTDFFRNPEAWRLLEELVIEPLVKAKSSDAAIRVWVPGCATGEEPYSLAMLLLEHLQRTRKYCPVQIFASDIDKDALDYARRARYPNIIATDVSPERLGRFFELDAQHSYYRVSKPLREAICFAEQNVLTDPPFPKLDLICCRNLLIYLRPEVQQKIIGLFHFALVEGGHLFLGGSETIGRHEDLFQAVSHKWRIYRRIGSTPHDKVAFPVSAAAPHHQLDMAPPRAQRREGRLAHMAQQQLLDWLAPRSVLVDKNGQIAYFCGDTDAFLTHAPGAPTQDLLAKARQGLRTKLRGLVKEALENGETVTAEARVKRDGRFHPVRIAARPVRDPANEEALVLVVFEEGHGHGTPRVPPLADAAGTAVTPRETTEINSEEVIQQLEDELAASREDLQTTIEQLETSNEEFKAANEEVMSGNEELQSANEELETSKEELQSLNEELNTLNSQLGLKVEELESKTNDLSNLLASTDIATICLDRTFCIKWFTPATTRLMNLIASDVGRPLADFSHKFASEDLLQDAKRVLDQLAPVEAEVVTIDDRCYLRRVTAYRTSDDRIDGVVITFVDITERKRAEEALRRSEEKLRILNQSLEAQVTERIGALAVLQDVTRIANQAQSVEEAMRGALARLCDANRWLMGQVYQLAHGNRAQLVSSGIWIVRADVPQALRERLAEFHRSISSVPVARGEGVLGRVLATVQPQWAEDFSAPPDWPGANPAQHELRSMIACPVTITGKVVAALALFSDESIAEERGLMEILPNVGIQLGYVIERKRLETEIAEVTDRERHHLGEEVHDGLSQQLAGAALLADGLAKSLRASRLPDAAKAEALAEALEVAKRQGRALIKGLLPVEVAPSGLMVALKELAEYTQNLYGVCCFFECQQPVPVEDSSTATHLYRIAHEAIHNAVKHARAGQIAVRLSNGDQKSLIVQDNGIGLGDNAQAGGVGIRLMRYRAGLIGALLTIESSEGEGTTVTCRFGGASGLSNLSGR